MLGVAIASKYLVALQVAVIIYLLFDLLVTKGPCASICHSRKGSTVGSMGLIGAGPALFLLSRQLGHNLIASATILGICGNQ
jgi:hypothetical protein